MEIRGLAFLPCFWVTWTLVGLFVAYAVTVAEGHAPTYLLYISETGSYFPESAVFTAVFMLSSILGAATVCVEYKFLDIRSAAIGIHCAMSQRVLLVVGLSSCIGTFTVAAFQVEAFPVIHRTGAVMSLGLGSLYNLCQSKSLYRMSLSDPYVCHIRMTLSLMMAASLITFLLFKIPLIYQLCNGRCEEICHTSAVTSEWLSVLTFMLHYLTYYTDFQHLCILWRCDKSDCGLKIYIFKQEKKNMLQCSVNL
ncbi:DNA damage-regulated autophagy modulator protein 1-like [Hyla sarda]|uniref:DNA damage-regulated autophagy modulator protein 1-like n=1 Tax=Hyla sarda TaxID=327740 RepID=UPI0024C27013|nr:DNA damage-regulated autophagy modulator protein 1-like [Hyla sarda]